VALPQHLARRYSHRLPEGVSEGGTTRKAQLRRYLLDRDAARARQPQRLHSGHDPRHGFALVATAVLVPVLLGARVYVGLSEAAFRRVVMVLLTLAGIALLASALPVLWRR
jgi:hypothetical protein